MKTQKKCVPPAVAWFLLDPDGVIWLNYTGPTRRDLIARVDSELQLNPSRWSINWKDASRKGWTIRRCKVEVVQCN